MYVQRLYIANILLTLLDQIHSEWDLQHSCCRYWLNKRDKNNFNYIVTSLSSVIIWSSPLETIEARLFALCSPEIYEMTSKFLT